MAGCIVRTFTDNALYGQCLTSLPEAAWHFATSDDLFLYTRPDPGTAQRINCFMERFQITTIHEDGSKTMIFATNVLPGKYIELVFRRVIGSLIAAVLCLTAAPLGFAIKAIHLLAGTSALRIDDEGDGAVVD